MDTDDHGKRLSIIIKTRYGSVKNAVDAMKKNGCSMSEYQLRRIQNGRWPNKEQALMLSNLLDVSTGYLLFGLKCPLDKLSPRTRPIAERLIDDLAKLESAPPPDN